MPKQLINKESEERFELNFSVDKPTNTGRVYQKDIFVEALEKAIKRGLLVYHGNSSVIPRVDTPIGKCVGYEIKEDGKVFIKATLEKGIKHLDFVSTQSVGRISYRKVTELKIESLFTMV